MSNAALQDEQWLMCVTQALGFDDLEFTFERKECERKENVCDAAAVGFKRKLMWGRGSVACASATIEKV